MTAYEYKKMLLEDARWKTCAQCDMLFLTLPLTKSTVHLCPQCLINRIKHARFNARLKNT